MQNQNHQKYAISPKCKELIKCEKIHFLMRDLVYNISGSFNFVRIFQNKIPL